MSQTFAHGLVMRHQPLARSLAWKAGGSKCPESFKDLLSVANLGLTKAAKTFRPDTGVTFGAYAKTVARNEILDFLRASKTPAPHLLVDLDSKDGQGMCDTFSVEESAIEAQAVAVWTKRTRGALANLKPRNRYIFAARHLRETPETLASLAERFGVSIERIRQLDIEAAARVQQIIAQPFNEAASRFPSRAGRLQHEIAAMPPAKDPADNVTRTAIVGMFGISHSDESPAVERKIQRTLAAEARRRSRVDRVRARAKMAGLTWAKEIAA